jgi:hypothetical protein
VNTIKWVSMASKNELNEYLSKKNSITELSDIDANTWGYFEIKNDQFLKIGYVNVGLKPQAILFDEAIYIGINEIFVGYQKDFKKKIFSYKMPTIFHEFINLSDSLIIRDEVGFIGLSRNGEQNWIFLVNGPIEEYNITECLIEGKTMDNETFSFQYK